MQRSHSTQSQSTASHCRLTSPTGEMHSKVSSDWLPSYIKATRPVLKIFKMAGYFPDSPRTLCSCACCSVNVPADTCVKRYGWWGDISTWHAVGLYWVTRHAGVQGNEIADDLARGGSVLKFVGPYYANELFLFDQVMWEFDLPPCVSHLFFCCVTAFFYVPCVALFWFDQLNHITWLL
jgi:hypothetical protein